MQISSQYQDHISQIVPKYFSLYTSLGTQMKHWHSVLQDNVSFTCYAIILCVLFQFLSVFAHSRIDCAMSLEWAKRTLHLLIYQEEWNKEKKLQQNTSWKKQKTVMYGIDWWVKGFTVRVQTLVLLTLSLQNTVGTSRSSLHQNCNQIHTQGPTEKDTALISHMIGFKYLYFKSLPSAI